VTVRLFYVDDSGASETRTIVFGWVELDVTAWRPVLRSWLDWRSELQRTIGIPTDYELHGTKFVGGRGHPTGTEWDAHKAERLPVIADALRTVGRMPGLAVGAVYACADDRRGYRDLKARAYVELVQALDERLTAAGDFGMIVMDGDGTDPTYRAAHRELKLASRSLIEDPFFHASNHSQWVQMADLVAYAAYMHLAQLPSKEPTWQWYRDHLGTAVTGATPLELKASRKKARPASPRAWGPVRKTNYTPLDGVNTKWDRTRSASPPGVFGAVLVEQPHSHVTVPPAPGQFELDRRHLERRHRNIERKPVLRSAVHAHRVRCAAGRAREALLDDAAEEPSPRPCSLFSSNVPRFGYCSGVTGSAAMRETVAARRAGRTHCHLSAPTKNAYPGLTSGNLRPVPRIQSWHLSAKTKPADI